MVKKSETPINVQTTVPRASILIDHTFNAREKIDEKATVALAQDIKLSGLLQPVVVRPKDKDGKYFLVAGFRRMAALEMLGWADIPVSVMGSNEEKDAFLANLAENVNREELSGYELAMAVKYIRDTYQMKPAVIALRLSGKAESYIKNLARVVDNVMEEILDQWRQGHKAATTDLLNKLAKLRDKESGAPLEEAQYKVWTAECRARKIDPGFGDGKNDPQGERPDPDADTGDSAQRDPQLPGAGGTKVTKPNAGMMQQLAEEIEQAATMGDIPEDVAELAKEVALFAIGQETAVNYGKFIFDPQAIKAALKVQKEKEAAEKAMLIADEKAKAAKAKVKAAREAAKKLQAES